jgi:hypothetical protein
MVRMAATACGEDDDAVTGAACAADAEEREPEDEREERAERGAAIEGTVYARTGKRQEPAA